MSKIREIYQMERKLRIKSPRKHGQVMKAHAKTFDHLERRGGASGRMPASPALVKRVDALHDHLSRQRNPASTKGVTFSQTLGRLMLDYVNEHDPDVSAFEIIAAEASGDQRGTRVPMRLAVQARAEIKELLELQTDPMAREELEGFLDNFDFAIEKARRKNPSEVKKLVKKTRGQKAKSAATRSSRAGSAAKDVRKAKVKSVLKTLEKNPGKSSADMYIGMLPTLDDKELKAEKDAVERRLGAVHQRDKGPGKSFRVTQLRKMRRAIEQEQADRRQSNPPKKSRKKRPRDSYDFSDDDIRLIQKYQLRRSLSGMTPDQIDAILARARVEDIEDNKLPERRRSIKGRATKMVQRYPAIKERIAEGEVFEVDPKKMSSVAREDFELSKRTAKFDRASAKTRKFSQPNPLRKVTERTPEKRFRETVRENTKTEIHMGRPPEQAYAIALSMARKQAPNRAKKIYGLPPKRNPKSKKKNPYRGDGHAAELKRLWMKWHEAAKELESAVKHGTVPQVQSAIRKVIKRRGEVEGFMGGRMGQPDVIEGVPRRALDARVKKEAKALHDEAYESLLSDIQKLTFREDRPFRDPRPSKPKRRRLFGRRENPAGARELVAECRHLWDRYCERPGATRLRAVAKHCERMKESDAKSVKKERAKCMQAIRAEAKSRKFKL